MRIKRIIWKKIIPAIFGILLVYSFLPMIRFWFMEGAPLEDNNKSSIDLLAGNEGVYFSFIVWGDNHSGLFFNDSTAMKLIWHMNREDRTRLSPIDFVISTGDVTLDGKESHFRDWKKIQELIKYPVIAAVGNHDDLELFNKYVGPEQFTFVNRNSYFIVIDNKRGNPRKSGMEWLEEKLKEGQDYDHIFVIKHKPAFVPYQQDQYNEDNSFWAYKFRKLCAEYGVSMVFSGHKHLFKSEIFDGVEHIVTGGGGMLTEIPDRDGGYHHYVRVMVNNDYVTYEVRRVSPPLWKFLTFHMWKDIVYWFRDWYGSGYIFGRNTEVLQEREANLNKPEHWTSETL